MSNPRLEVYNSKGSIQIKDGYRPFVLRKAGGLYGRDFKPFYGLGYYYDIDVTDYTSPVFFYRATTREQSVTHRLMILKGRKILRVIKEEKASNIVNSDGWLNQRTQYYIFDRWSAPDAGGPGLRIYKEDGGDLLFCSTWKFMDVVGVYPTTTTYSVRYNNGLEVKLNSTNSHNTGRHSKDTAATIDGPRTYAFNTVVKPPTSVRALCEGAILDGTTLRYTLISSPQSQRTIKGTVAISRFLNDSPASTILINTTNLPNDM